MGGGERINLLDFFFCQFEILRKKALGINPAHVFHYFSTRAFYG